jgi:hypothetical protein
MQTQLSSLLFFVAVIVTSCNSDCSKKVDCPAFNDAVLSEWFPYKDNTSLIFLSVNSTDTFQLKNTEKSGPYEIAVGGLGNNNRDCHASNKFQSVTQNTVNFSAELSSILYSYSTTPARFVYLKIFNNDIQAQDLKDNGFTTIIINGQPCAIEYFPSLQVGGRTYSNVQKATRDTVTIRTPGIFQVYIAKGNGLVGYSQYPSLDTKIKQ